MSAASQMNGRATCTYRKESLQRLRIQRQAEGDVTDPPSQQKRKQHEVQLLAPRMRWECVFKPHKALHGQGRYLREPTISHSFKGIYRGIPCTLT